jgi:4-hydroxy-2-oxoheptanedioate aldolase
MGRSKLFRKLDEGRIAIGTLIYASGPEWLEIAGHAGLDWCKIDLMTTEMDWVEAATMVRAACAYRMTPVIRLPTLPFGTGGVDRHLAVDATRAFAVGAEAVTASINYVEEVALLVEAAKEGIVRPFLGRHSYQENGETRWTGALASEDGPGQETLAIPMIETIQGFRALDDILRVPGLKALAFGLGDLSRELGHNGDERHPDMQDKLRTATAKARERGVHVFLNPLQDSPAEIAASSRLYREMGVSAISVNPPIGLVHRYFEESRALIEAIESRPVPVAV